MPSVWGPTDVHGNSRRCTTSTGRRINPLGLGYNNQSVGICVRCTIHCTANTYKQIKSAESWFSHLNIPFYQIESQCSLVERCISLRPSGTCSWMRTVTSDPRLMCIPKTKTRKCLIGKQVPKHYRLWRISNFQQHLKRSFNQSFFPPKRKLKAHTHLSAHSLRKHTHYPLSLTYRRYTHASAVLRSLQFIYL